MYVDVQELRNFYYRSTLGRAVQKTVRAQIADVWPEAKGQTVVGFGFAVPFLRPYLADARRTIADARPAGRDCVATKDAKYLGPVRRNPVACGYGPSR